jgi:hypothetical protein
LAGAACTTDIFQNGLFVWIMTVIPFVLLVAVKVKGRPLGEVAVTGRMSDLPAGTVTLLIGSKTGAAKTGDMKRNVAKTLLNTTWRFIQ